MTSSAAALSRTIALALVFTLIPGTRALALASDVRVQPLAQPNAQPEATAPQSQPQPGNPPASSANSAPQTDASPSPSPAAAAETPKDSEGTAPSSVEPTSADEQDPATASESPPQAGTATPVTSSSEPVRLGPEPKFRGVGLMVAGGLLGSAAVYPALFGGMLWLVVPSDDGMGATDDALDDTRRLGRTIFLFGVVGLIAGGVMLTSGIVLNQRHRAWRDRAIRAGKYQQARVVPWHQWNGRSHRFGIAARF